MTTHSSEEHNHSESVEPKTPLSISPSEPGQSRQEDQSASDLAALSDTIVETPTVILPAQTSTAETIGKSDIASQPTQRITTDLKETHVAEQADQSNTTGPSSGQPEATVNKTLQKKVLPRLVKVLLITLAILLVLGGGSASAAYYYYQTTIQKPLKQIIRPVARSQHEPTPLSTSAANNSSDLVTGKSWNVLLLGSDNDQKYVFPNVLTQVMMVVHVDTVNNKVTMVSIPRDSWVSVPDGMGMHKIDQAFALGVRETGKFEDGVRLARQTVEQDYGIQIDRYAWVGLDGFAKVIDTLHGIDINVDHPVVDDAYPNDVGAGSDPNDHNAYKRLYLSPGPRHLNGQETLEYVRSRHSDLVGDIGRTQRQQQVLEALKLKLNVSTLLQNFSSLLNDLSGSLYTDFSEDEMLAFANYGRTLLNQPIDHLTLGIGQGAANYGELATIYDPSVGANQDVIIPHCDIIQPAINRIFDLGDTQSCRVNG